MGLRRRLAGNERNYLNRGVDSNWISKGPFVAAFENAFRHYLGCQHGVACSSGTVALHLLLSALGLGPGDEVIIPAFTMIAVANAVRYTGASCRVVDSESRYLTLIPGQEIEVGAHWPFLM
jgi:perosamine synthetase